MTMRQPTEARETKPDNVSGNEQQAEQQERRTRWPAADSWTARDSLRAVDAVEKIWEVVPAGHRPLVKAALAGVLEAKGGV